MIKRSYTAISRGLIIDSQSTIEVSGPNDRRSIHSADKCEKRDGAHKGNGRNSGDLPVRGSSVGDATSEKGASDEANRDFGIAGVQEWRNEGYKYSTNGAAERQRGMPGRS